MKAKRRHRCGLACYRAKGARLLHACKHCKHAKLFPGKLTKRQKICAVKFIPEEITDLKKHKRWTSLRQAIAVGLSRARSQC